MVESISVTSDVTRYDHVGPDLANSVFPLSCVRLELQTPRIESVWHVGSMISKPNQDIARGLFIFPTPCSGSPGLAEAVQKVTVSIGRWCGLWYKSGCIGSQLEVNILIVRHRIFKPALTGVGWLVGTRREESCINVKSAKCSSISSICSNAGRA